MTFQPQSDRVGSRGHVGMSDVHTMEAVGSPGVGRRRPPIGLRRSDALVDDLRALERFLSVDDAEQLRYRKAFLETVLMHLRLTSLELWWMGRWRDVPWVKCVARATDAGKFVLGSGRPVADEKGEVVRTLRSSGVYLCNDVGANPALLELAAAGGRTWTGALLATCVSLNGHACSAFAAERGSGSCDWTNRDVEDMRRASAMYALHVSRVAQAARVGDPRPVGDEGFCHCFD